MQTPELGSFGEGGMEEGREGGRGIERGREGEGESLKESIGYPSCPQPGDQERETNTN